MADRFVALVIGASAEQLSHIKQCLADWECASVPLDDEEAAVSSALPAAKLIIVYARKEQKSTLTICEQLRNSPENHATPILLVIGRYEITQGSAVRDMGSAGFIITPFDEKELHNKITDLLEGS